MNQLSALGSRLSALWSRLSALRSRLSASRLALTALVALSAPVALGAQSSAVVDEATFTITQNGASLGRESFRILRAPGPGGQVFRAQGTSALADSKASTTLATDSTGVPVSYESELSQRGVVVQRLQGRGRPGRFSVLVQTKSGESAREYILNNGALVLDENVFHHFFFVGLAAQHTHLVVIEPRTAQQNRFQLTDRGAESVDIGGRSIAGRHFALTIPSGGSREVWIDEQGRLLKVAIPEKGLVALRDDPPR